MRKRDPTPLRREVALALVCAGLLMLEICLTKIFSIVLWYHFGFLAVSTAMLGFAAAGVWLTRRGEAVQGDAADRPIAGAAAMAAVVGVAMLWLVTQTTFDVYTLVQDRTIGVLLAFVVEVTLPFFFLGVVVSRTLAAWPERVNRLYGADLVGSAAGCGLAVLVLSAGWSGQAAILLASLLVGVGGCLFAGAQPAAAWRAALGAAVPAVVLLFADPQQAFPLRSPKSKPYYRVESLETGVADAERISWYRGALTLKSGEVLEVETPMPPRLTADGQGVLVETDDGPRTVALADVAPAAKGDGLAFETKTWSPWRTWSTLSRVDAFHWPKPYGAWGLWGLSDRYHTEAEATSPLPRQKGITIDAWAMTSILRWSGAPLWPPGTPAVDAERHKLKVLEYLPAGTVHRVVPQAPKVVCIGAGGGLDLLTAEYFGAGHVTGVEINPGVVDAARLAFPEFAGHLYDRERHPDIEVHVAEGRHFLERSDQRYDVVQLSGVDTFSTSEAGAFALSENYLYTVEAFRTYFEHLTPNGVATLTRWFVPSIGIGPNGEPVLHCRYELRLLGLARQSLLEHGVRDPGASIFYLKSKGFTVILMKPSGFTGGEVELLRRHCEHYGYDVLWSPEETPATVRHLDRTFPNPFLAFMRSEDPTAWLEAQPFDVTPPRDDRPFYFEVSRFAHILQPDHYLNSLGGLTAHGTLMILLAEVLLLGFLFVVWPLRRLAAAPFPNSRRVRAGLLLYFSAIGFGFIVVEIVLSQKFILYLGHPFYALAVILFAVLLFSGLGAMASKHAPLPRFATAIAAALAVAAAFGLDLVFERTLHLDLAVRIAIAVAMLAPVGFAMGMPFPLGIARLGAVRPQLIPWAWSVNGYTSVLGSVLAVMLGIELGFTAVLLIAAGVYVLGVAGYALLDVPAAGGDASAPSRPAAPLADVVFDEEQAPVG